MIRLDFRPLWPEFLCLHRKGITYVRTQKPHDPGFETRRIETRHRRRVSSGRSPIGRLLHDLAGLKFFYVNTLGYEWPLLTKKSPQAASETVAGRS